MNTVTANSWPPSGEPGRMLHCPVCDQAAQAFTTYGDPPRRNARCPTCGSLERHRLAWLFLSRHTDLNTGHPRRMLHIAPEPSLTRRFRTLSNLSYLSADLTPGRAMAIMDITDIGYPDRTFDVIWCSHVLEHVAADRRAISELHRVLTDGGWAAFQVPISKGPTYEDFSIVRPEDRTRAFGQFDHVRRYGIDFQDRLGDAGFHVRRLPTTEIAGADEIESMALSRTDNIFLCIR